MIISILVIALIIVLSVQYSGSFTNKETTINNLNLWLFTNQRKLLKAHFEFYRMLTDSDKKEFLVRLNTIIKNKIFVGRNDLIVSAPMKTLIAASITQLTFGFRKYLLPQYKTIFIYPDAYLNRRTQKFYKGETNTNGFITFSWNYFLEGYRIPDDRRNLGLHETAHALLNTIIYSNLHDPELDEKLLTLDKIPADEKNRLFAGEDQFFRDYGKTNIKEFFAVAVECFFEAPERFKMEYPVFYRLMCQLLNQDPAGRIYRFG